MHEQGTFESSSIRRKSDFADVRKLYEYAYEIEQMLIENGAVADKDYKILDLFKLAVEWRKAISIEYVGEMIREQQ